MSWSDSLMLLGHVLEQQIWASIHPHCALNGGYHGLPDLIDKLLFNAVLTFGYIWQILAMHVHNLDHTWEEFDSAWLHLS